MTNGAMLLLAVLLQLVPFISAQSVHNISVGVEGSFFTPPTTSAGEGDTVNFIFGGDIHDVTQSTFQAPCSPLSGGFSSGFMGRGPDFSMPTLMWSLTITNASMPIWFFCAATRPTSHCESGMVGSINPPSQDQFQQFVDAAKRVTSTPVFLPSLVLTGIGAIATPPITIAGATAPSTTPAPAPGPASSTTTTSSSTSAPTSSSSSPASHSNSGAVIGGAVGAAIGAVVLIAIAVFLCYRIRKRRLRRESATSSFFAYNPHPHQHKNERGLLFSPTSTQPSTLTSAAQSPNNITAFDIDTQSNPMTQKQPLLRATSASALMVSESHHNNPSTFTSPIQPQRYLQHAHSAGQIQGTQAANTQGFAAMYNQANNPSINRQASNGASARTQTHTTSQNLVPHVADESSQSGVSGEGMDIQALAKEVAAVLREEKEEAGRTATRDGTYGGAHTSTQSHETAPPRYHTVNS